MAKAYEVRCTASIRIFQMCVLHYVIIFHLEYIVKVVYYKNTTHLTMVELGSVTDKLSLEDH